MGGGRCMPAPLPWLLPFIKTSEGNPYLKILDFSQLFVAYAPMKKFSFTTSQALFGW